MYWVCWTNPGPWGRRRAASARKLERPERSLAPRRRYSSKLGHDEDALADRSGSKPQRQASGKRIRTRTRRGEERFQGASTGTVAIIWKMPLSIHLEMATESPQRLPRCRFWVCNLSPPQASGLESRHPEAPRWRADPGRKFQMEPKHAPTSAGTDE